MQERAHSTPERVPGPWERVGAVGRPCARSWAQRLVPLGVVGSAMGGAYGGSRGRNASLCVLACVRHDGAGCGARTVDAVRIPDDRITPVRDLAYKSTVQKF